MLAEHDESSAPQRYSKKNNAGIRERCGAGHADQTGSR
jgi:hypothetical protein